MNTLTPRPDPEERDPGDEAGSRGVEMQSDCERIAPTLHRYVEGELDRIRSLVVESHIATCPACLSEKERLDLERLWLVETAFHGPVLSARLVEKVMEPVRREAAARSRSRRWRGLRYVAAGAAAAACLLALSVGESSGPWSGLWKGRTELPGGGGALISTTRLESPASPPEGDGASGTGPRPVLVSAREGHLNEAERWRLERSNPGIVHLAFDDVVQPIERGGFRAGETNPTFVDFGPSNVSCLPQEAPPEDHSGQQDEPSCEFIIPAEDLARGPRSEAGRTRIFRVKLISLRSRTAFRFNFRDSFGIALRLTGGGESDRGDIVDPPATSIVEPCFPDPNLDGKTDSRDIAYGLQVLYGAQPPDLFDADAAALDPECEGSCLRA